MTWRRCCMERRDDVDWSLIITVVFAVLIYLATIAGCIVVMVIEGAIDIGLILIIIICMIAIIIISMIYRKLIHTCRRHHKSGKR